MDSAVSFPVMMIAVWGIAFVLISGGMFIYSSGFKKGKRREFCDHNKCSAKYVLNASITACDAIPGELCKSGYCIEHCREKCKCTPPDHMTMLLEASSEPRKKT